MRCNRLFVLLTIAVVCVFLTTGFQGCDDDGDTPPIGSGPSTAQVRVIHASPNTPAVDVFIAGVELVSDLEFRESTQYRSIQPGAYRLEVFPANTKENPLITTTLNLTEGTSQTVLAIGTRDSIRPLVLRDDLSAPPPGRARIRLVHAGSDAPPLDILIPQLQAPAFQNIRFGEVTQYRVLDAGTYTVVVTPAGNPENEVFRVPSLRIESGAVYTAVVTGRLADDTLSVTLYRDR